MKFFLIYFFIFSSLQVYSQNWSKMDMGIELAGVGFFYNDKERNELYVHGTIFNSGRGDTLRGIGKWNGSFFEKLGNGVAASPICNSVLRYQNRLYASGVWKMIPPNTFRLAAYNDETSSWDSLFNSIKGLANLLEIDNELIASGWYDTCYGIPTCGICSFNGNNWSSLLTISNLNGGFHNIQSVAKYKGQLYVGGNFSLPNSSMQMINDLAIVENNQIQSFGGGFQNGSIGAVSQLIVFKGELYIIGDFTEATGNAGNYIMRWDGQTLRDVGGGTDFYINDLIVYNEKLFAIGSFSYAGGIYSPRIAYWDGESWFPLNGGDDFGMTGLWSGEIFNDELYVVGNFETILGDTFNYVAKYNHQLPGDENELEVFINNPGEEIIVQYENNNEFTLAVAIFTTSGQQVVPYYVYPHQQGYIHQSIPIPGLASGVYIVTAFAGNKKVSKKLVKI